MSKIIKNYLYNIISLLTGTLFPFIIFPYISRILMPEYIGKVNFAQSFANYFITLALLGIPIYGVRELSKVRGEKYKEEFSKIFTELFIIAIIFSIISFVLFIYSLMMIKKVANMRIILIIYSLQIIFAFLNIDYIFITLEKHKRRTIRTIILRILSLIFIFKFIKTPKDYIVYVFILVLPEIIARIIDVYIYKKLFLKNFKILNLKRHMKPLTMIFLYVFSVSIYLNLDSTMLGIMKTDEEVGFYTTGSKLVKMLIPIMSILGTVMAPRMVELIKENKNKKLYIYMDKFIDYIFIIGIPMMFLMIILSKDVILLISGTRYINSNLTMKIISLILLILPIGTFLGGQVLLPNNKEKIIFKIALYGMVCNIIMNFILIPIYGIEGAAIATVFTETLICIFRIIEVKKIYKNYYFITSKRIYYVLLGIISTVGTFMLKVGNNIYLFIIIYGFIYLFGLVIIENKNIIYFYAEIRRGKL